MKSSWLYVILGLMSLFIGMDFVQHPSSSAGYMLIALGVVVLLSQLIAFFADSPKRK